MDLFFNGYLNIWMDSNLVHFSFRFQIYKLSFRFMPCVHFEVWTKVHLQVQLKGLHLTSHVVLPTIFDLCVCDDAGECWWFWRVHCSCSCKFANQYGALEAWILWSSYQQVTSAIIKVQKILPHFLYYSCFSCHFKRLTDDV